MTSNEKSTFKDINSSLGIRKVLEEYTDNATVSILRILKEAYRVEEQIPIEQTPYEFVIRDVRINGNFIRILTGVNGETKQYSLVGIFNLDKDNDVLSNEKARRVCDLMDMWLEAFPPFRFRNYYDNKFSTTIFIACRRFRRTDTRDLVIKSRRHRNTLYIFVPVRDVRFAVSVTLCYLANMFGHRLFRFLNSTMRWGIGKFYGIWSRFRKALRGRLDGITSSMSNSINYIIEILEKVDAKFSHGVRLTTHLLFNLFRNVLRELDKFLRPIVLEIRAKSILEFTRKVLRTSYGEIRKVLARSLQLLVEEDTSFAERYVEILSRSLMIPFEKPKPG